MKYCTLVLLAILLITAGSGCRQADEVINVLSQKRDSTPPTLISWQMKSPSTATLTFSEPVVIKGSDFSIETIGITSATVSMTTVTITMAEAIALGKCVRLYGRVEDLSRNSLRFAITLWAKNPQPARLLINEFTTKGTEVNPDRVELVVLERGNLAGITLYAGSPASYSDRLIFEDRWAERGTYVVVRFQDGQDGGEFESEQLAGLSSNNGALSVALTPEWSSPIMDAVVWGNRVTTTYEGFGSEALLTQVGQLAEAGQWSSNKSGDSIDSSLSTATRSFCRDRLIDTNSERDWYICDTRQASFGGPNSEKRYSP